MNKITRQTEGKSTVYQITIEGRLDAARSTWFDGFEIQYRDEATVLTGTLVDSQALFGVIERIRDLGLSLVDVHKITA